MITIMLADDNLFALEHYSNLVDWKQYGFELIATAEDGLEAWEKYCRFHPDVVITDIHMPGINGIDLAGKIRKQDQSTIVIFLSSYNEFDYARSALNLSVQEYILKHELDQETLIQKLIEIKELLKKREQQMRSFQSNCLSSYFKMTEPSIETGFGHYISEKPFCLIIIEQDHVPEQIVQHTHHQVPPLNSKQLKSVVLQYFSDVLFCSHYDTYRWLCLCTFDCDRTTLSHRMKQVLNSTLNVPISIFSFGVFANMEECKNFYISHSDVFFRRYFENTGIVVDISYVVHSSVFVNPSLKDLLDESQTRGFASWNCDKFSHQLEGIEKFCQEFEMLHYEDCIHEMDQLFLPTILSADYHAFFYLTDLIFEKLEEYSKNKIRYHENSFVLYDDGTDRLLSVHHILKWLKEKVFSLLQIMEKQPQTQSEALEKAIRFIYQQYTNPLLSIDDIAQKVCLSVNGLNNLFKKSQGETAGRFLTRVRMEKAAQLLLERENKISDLPQKTGYSSASYFTRVFQKYYGMSPTEYRTQKAGQKNHE